MLVEGIFNTLQVSLMHQFLYSCMRHYVCVIVALYTDDDDDDEGWRVVGRRCRESSELGTDSPVGLVLAERSKGVCSLRKESAEPARSSGV